jgi:serine/threonine-protein kinase
MPLSNGDVFAGYTILKLLGSGGMGEVYLAQHPRLPRRDALKVLPAHLTADSEFRQRFSREADLAAGLSHPHIVGIHDRGEYQGQLWISMDYVQGTDAAELVRSRYPSGMPHPEVVEIVSAVADALDYAHAQGLLHRDVKPANILLGEPTSRGRRILLADFGIARQLGDVSGLTATNMMVGTTAYAAPEQLKGTDVDGRADQYALGCTAFHLLTGVAPFRGANPAVVITAHLSQPAPLIGARRAELAPLNGVLTKALAKNPAARYASCLDFATALRDQVSGTGAAAETLAAPHIAAPPAPPRRRRSALLVAAIATIVVIAAAAAAGAHLLRGSSGQPSAESSAPTSAPVPEAIAPTTPSVQLSRYVTDESGVLTPAGRAAVERSINKLYAERQVRLWVVYVNDFSGLTPLRWAEDAMRANRLTDTDALLAIATGGRHFSFRVPAAVTDGTAINVEEIRRSRIEPAVSRGEWARAAVVAAEGLA